MSFKAFLNAAKEIITIGASINAASRYEIRTVIGELGDELDRALLLTDSYLVGAKFSIDDNELSHYLADVNGKLMNSFLEHHICAGLYHLADKFKQLFNPTKFTVSIASFRLIPKLIDELKNGEQVALDDLQDIVDQLRNYSDSLHAGRITRAEILGAIESHRKEIGRYRQSIKIQRRSILSKL